VLKGIGSLGGTGVIIPHGLEAASAWNPGLNGQSTNIRMKAPYRVLYVSIVDQYKHTWRVVDAVAQVRGRHNGLWLWIWSDPRIHRP
jgi:hypothetical protein